MTASLKTPTTTPATQSGPAILTGRRVIKEPGTDNLVHWVEGKGLRARCRRRPARYSAFVYVEASQAVTCRECLRSLGRKPAASLITGSKGE